MFGSFGAGFGSFGSGVGGLLPSFTNITSWLKTPTADGKTLANSKGTDADLTGVNCLSFDGSGDRVQVNSSGGVDLTTDAENNLGSCVITATFKQEVLGTQIVYSNGSAAYRLYTQNNFLKVNSDSTEIFAIEANKVYRSTITYNANGQVTNFVLENFTDETTQTDSTTRAAGNHTGSSGFQIGARNGGLNWNGKISNFSVSNSSVGANFHLPLAEGSGSVAYDVSGTGANGDIILATHSTLDGIESWNHEYGFDIDGAVKVPALNTKTKQVATFDGVADKLTATGITGSSVITHDGTATLTAGTGEITSTAGTAYNIKVDGVLTFTMSTGIGTSTITSENGAIGNASVTVGSGGLDSFWGQRVADASGSLVSADYATGNTSISNPAGYVHNNSECGVSMVTNSLTAAQLFAIDNSTATQTFIRKDNGNIVQILDYSAALTGSDLDRTRSYVG